MAETVNVAHAAQQMGAGGRTDQSQRHGFFESLVKEDPVRRPAGIGFRDIGAAPDAVTGGEQNLIRIKGVDHNGANPVRRAGLGVRRAGIIPHGGVGHPRVVSRSRRRWCCGKFHRADASGRTWWP